MTVIEPGLSCKLPLNRFRNSHPGAWPAAGSDPSGLVPKQPPDFRGGSGTWSGGTTNLPDSCSSRAARGSTPPQRRSLLTYKSCSGFHRPDGLCGIASWFL